MRKLGYITTPFFILGLLFLLRPSSPAYAYDITTDNPVHSISGDFTQQDLKDFMTMTSLAQEILDGGQLDFSEINTPIEWIDFVDGFTAPIFEAIDDLIPVDTNIAGVWERLNEAQIYYWDQGIVDNLNGQLGSIPHTGDMFRYLMRSQAQKDQIGTSVGETILDMAKDVYDMAVSSQTPTYLPQDYLWFQNINKLYYNDVDFFHFTTFRSWRWTDVWYSLNNPMPSYSYYLLSVENSPSFGHLPRTGDTPTYLSVTSYLPKFSIYYDTATNTATYSASNRSDFLSGDEMSHRLIPPFNPYDGIDPNGFVMVQQGYGEPELRTSFPNFDTALNWFYQHWFNIDFYVNGDPWVIAEENVDGFKFGGTTVYEGTNYPLGVSIPDFHSFDFDKFKSYIIDAINHSSVLMYTDIADCFLDINGQTCVATYNVIRNDYDNLVAEQFNMVSYPRFNSDLYTQDLVNQFRDDTQAGVAIIKNSYDIIPTSLSNALLYCGLLILFGLIIRRFLE